MHTERNQTGGSRVAFLEHSIVYGNPVSRPRAAHLRHARCWVGVVMMFAVTSGVEIRAQLAITEVMSWASTNCGDCGVLPRGCHPDLWELTNFGTNEIDLTGYRFWDETTVQSFDAVNVLPSTIIAPRESIIFVRPWPEVPDAATFRAWWGESNLPANLQIFFYYPNNGPGFDELGDAVRVWDANTNLVDEFHFGEARRGVTFTYDTNSGEVAFSEPGVCGAFVAANCGDVGSPGWAPCGPVPSRITRQPVNQTVDAGGTVTLRVEAAGVPRPRGLQWYFEGVPIPSGPAGSETVARVVNYAGYGPAWTALPKATDLTIANVQPGHAGRYFAVFTNGLEQLTSAVVTLTVNLQPSPPTIVSPPAELRWPVLAGEAPTSLTVAPLQTATLDVIVRGYPTPAYRWRWSADGSNFVNLPGATNHTLLLPFVSTNFLAGHAGIYCVEATNYSGTATGYTTLTVREKPRLKITELMAESCGATGDWWELTNVGSEPVNLYGYRWDDQEGYIGSGPTITNNIIIQPGESVIFVEGRTPELFIAAWGASNLPSDLQFITYTANGLHAVQDEINLWNPTASDDADWLDQVQYSSVIPGRSYWFAPDDRFSVPSEEGRCAAIRSVQGCDVASPGWTHWMPPRITSIRRDGQTVRLEWKAPPGSTNIVQYCDVLASPATNITWIDLGSPVSSACVNVTATDQVGGTTQRFYRVYRVQQIAPANCP